MTYHYKDRLRTLQFREKQLLKTINEYAAELKKKDRKIAFLERKIRRNNVWWSQVRTWLMSTQWWHCVLSSFEEWCCRSTSSRSVSVNYGSVVYIMNDGVIFCLTRSQVSLVIGQLIGYFLVLELWSRVMFCIWIDYEWKFQFLFLKVVALIICNEAVLIFWKMSTINTNRSSTMMTTANKLTLHKEIQSNNNWSN